MVHLVTGGSGSGKSSYAEALFPAGGTYIYLATMKPSGEESKEKIRRHRRLRLGKGFVTVECAAGLDRVILPENDGVLLECVSNLAANELYREDGSLRGRRETEEKIVSGIENIRRQTAVLVVVTNEVCGDVGDYSSGTREYMVLLGKVNQRLARMADKVTEVVYGIPVPVK